MMPTATGLTTVSATRRAACAAPVPFGTLPREANRANTTRDTTTPNTEPRAGSVSSMPMSTSGQLLSSIPTNTSRAGSPPPTV